MLSSTAYFRAEERTLVGKVRSLSQESREELGELLEDLLDYEEDKRDARAMSGWAVRALAQEELETVG